jgi:hypothetical protein
MPPSTFARNGDPEGGGFGAALARLFGMIGKGASDYQDYRRYGPDFRNKQRADEIARQEQEIALRQHQAALDYEPIKQAQGRLQNATSRGAVTKMLEQVVADALKGQEGQTEAAPLPQQGPFDTQLPPGTGPLAEGWKPKEPVPPQLNPADVEASGMPLESIIAGGRGLLSESKTNLEILRAQQRYNLEGLKQTGRKDQEVTRQKNRLDLAEFYEKGKMKRARMEQGGVQGRFNTAEDRRKDEFDKNQKRLNDNEAQREEEALGRLDVATLNARRVSAQNRLKNLDQDDDNYDTDKAQLVSALRAIDEKLAAPRAPRAPKAQRPDGPPPPSGGGGVMQEPTVQSKQDYDALPNGAIFWLKGERLKKRPGGSDRAPLVK